MIADQGFAAEVRRLCARRNNVALLLASSGLTLFSVLDAIVAKERFSDLLAIRIVGVAGLGLLFLLGRADKQDRWSEVLGVVSYLWMAVSVQALVMATGGHTSTYYAGLNLILVGVAVLMPWAWSRSLIDFLGVLAIYNVPILIHEEIVDVEMYVTNNFFLAFTGVIAVSGTAVGYAVRRREYSATRQLDQAVRELRALDQLKSDFIANLSHEMRTPLTLALAPLELLLEDRERAPRDRDLLAVAQRNSLRLLRLINDLLDLSRIDAKMEKVAPDEIQVEELVRNVTSTAGAFAERKGIQLGVKIASGGGGEIVADREKLERILLNLLSNALKFTPLGGKIEVQVAGDERSVTFSVIDTGIGIPAADRERVFARFHQVEGGSARRFGGTGIGLALVHEFVELHGGKVWIEGRDEGGTIVRVRMLRTLEHVPVERIDRRAAMIESQPPKRGADRGVEAWNQVFADLPDYRNLPLADASERRAGLRTTGTGESGRILVVDDSPDVLMMISLQLHGLHEVVLARSGKEALELAGRWRPSLIISDVMMPEMDGVELTARLAQDPETATIPVILLTARAGYDARLEGRKGGAVAYLTKPWRRAELLAAIDAILAKRRETARESASFQTRSTGLVAEGIAHEIRNPLGFVVNAQFLLAEVAAQSLEAAKASLDDRTLTRLKRMLKDANDSGQEGLRRIGDMVDRVALLGDTGATPKGDCDPAEVAQEVRRLVQPKLGAGHLSVAVTPVRVALPPGKLHQILLNLVKNALDAAGPEGHIEIAGEPLPGAYELTVADDGPGVPPDKREEIFAPFFTTKAPGKGTGLGLAVSRALAAEAGGTLELAEGRPKTTFVLRVPRA